MTMVDLGSILVAVCGVLAVSSVVAAVYMLYHSHDGDPGVARTIDEIQRLLEAGEEEFRVETDDGYVYTIKLVKEKEEGK